MKKMMLVLSFFVAGQVIAGVNERLLMAAKAEDLAGVEKALAVGAEVDAMDDDGDTALILAAWNGFDEMVKRLIEAGADVNAKNSFGDTALIFAASFGWDQVVQRLIEVGANVNANNDDGNTALISAAKKGKNEIVQILVVAGADVNAVNNDGNTALMEAARYGSRQMVNTLIAVGAHVNVQNKFKDTALSWAGNDQITKDLLVAGADIPYYLGKVDIDWLDNVIKKINEERVLEFQSFLSLQDRKNMPVQDLILLMYPLLPLASEVIAAKKLQRFGRGFRERILFEKVCNDPWRILDKKDSEDIARWHGGLSIHPEYSKMIV